MQLWIGTSGYVYPDWVGRFYPPRTSSRAMLPFYAEHFALVELNFTYYQVPSQSQLASMVHRVPPGFQFIVKANRALTHDLDWESTDAFADSLKPMTATGQLMHVLCQFPQRFHSTRANLDWLERVSRHFGDDHLAMEFRHASWDTAETARWLSERRITLVSVDVPDIPAIYPRKLVQTGRQIYVRFHSRRADLWYAAGHDRYDYLYSEDELSEWLGGLAERADHADRAVLLFNNCRHGHAVSNAQGVVKLLSERSYPFELVSPSPPRDTLF